METGCAVELDGRSVIDQRVEGSTSKAAISALVARPAITPTFTDLMTCGHARRVSLS